jgi:uncharacterized membrane protein YdjX (TVP38/TMEM64 family)
VGSIVLGLNDALVELTGTLAGLTFALQRGSIVAISGIITGIAAAFSMAASDYLASKAEGDPRAKKSAIYTGAAYLVTVVLLVLPYLLLPQRGGWIYLSLAITLLIAIGIIADSTIFGCGERSKFQDEIRRVGGDKPWGGRFFIRRRLNRQGGLRRGYINVLRVRAWPRT